MTERFVFYPLALFYAVSPVPGTERLPMKRRKGGGGRRYAGIPKSVKGRVC